MHGGLIMQPEHHSRALSLLKVPKDLRRSRVNGTGTCASVDYAQGNQHRKDCSVTLRLEERRASNCKTGVQATLRQLYAATEASMGSPLPSPAPSVSSPQVLGTTPRRFSTPNLDLPRFTLPASSTQRTIERHREEALQVSSR